MPVTIDAYRATFAAAETGTIVVAEMKKINAMRKITSDSFYGKLTP